MDLKTNTQEGTCPVSGLKQVSRPEWSYVGKKGGFQVKITLIGQHILHILVTGYVHYEDQIKSVQLQDKVARQAVDTRKPFVQIQDWRNFEGATNNARHYYFSYLESKKNVSALIFCNVSFMFKMSIKLGKRLNKVPFPIHITQDYEQAIRLALDIASKQSKKEINDVTDDAASLPTVENKPSFSEKQTCPISGLEILQLPEFSDISLDEDYFCTFRLIGDHIIFVNFRGQTTYKGALSLVKKHQEFVDAAGLAQKPYAEIRGYTQINAIPPIQAAIVVSDFIISESGAGRLKGFWMFNLPEKLKNIYNVGFDAQNFNIPVQALDNYESVIIKAISTLEKSFLKTGTQHKAEPIISKDGFDYN
ncbi:MAG: hypothetical protein GY729_03665, partial [Desulfobacteraceae bacterium]|nr:hypothetical protein [Desulfobacteraceae bacterium]